MQACGKRIVIVDDDRDLREMLRLRLEKEGYVVTVASSGLRLVGSLHADRPDLIILDVMMAWIDGFDLCRAIKKNPHYRHIPVFFVTALSSDEDVRRGYEAGATRYFTKPVKVEELVSAISSELKQEDAGS